MAPKSRVPFYIAGGGVYVIGMYISFHAYKIYKSPPPPQGCQHPAKQRFKPGVYDTLASSYDNRIGWDEFLMGLGSKRKSLVSEAKGHVLEVSAGTGRNLSYYDPEKIKSLTLTDASAEMLKEAYKKFKQDPELSSKWVKTKPESSYLSFLNWTYPKQEDNNAALERKESPGTKDPLKFVVMNSERLLLPSDSIDTVVDTFGLCSIPDPVVALQEMSRVCKPDGRILLLEHGRRHQRPSKDWINYLLDIEATAHAEKWSCWWNRDIPDIVSEAGLEVQSIQTSHFGTSYRIIAKPNKSSSCT